MNAAALAHLSPAARPQALLPDDERIRAMHRDRWVDYPRAAEARLRLERLLGTPERKFQRDHPTTFDDARGVERRQIVAMQMPASRPARADSDDAVQARPAADEVATLTLDDVESRVMKASEKCAQRSAHRLGGLRAPILGVTLDIADHLFLLDVVEIASTSEADFTKKPTERRLVVHDSSARPRSLRR